MTFDRFVAVDWTGALGERHRAIAVAEADADGGPPRLVVPERPWTRGEIGALVDAARLSGERTLFGFDMCFGLPFADNGSYFPGDASPPRAQELWAEVERVCAADAHDAAPSYVMHRRRHFWLGAHDGPRRPFERLRAVERVDAARGGTPSPVAVLLGAAQCGKASLAGMRLLARAGVPVWPMDPLPAEGPAVVEIYCRIFAKAGGARGKLRTGAALDAALIGLGSAPCGDAVPKDITDHEGDALVSAAGMRAAAADPGVWSPAGLTPAIAATEGWTFGIS